MKEKPNIIVNQSSKSSFLVRDALRWGKSCRVHAPTQLDGCVKLFGFAFMNTVTSSPVAVPRNVCKHMNQTTPNSQPTLTSRCRLFVIVARQFFPRTCRNYSNIVSQCLNLLQHPEVTLRILLRGGLHTWISQRYLWSRTISKSPPDRWHRQNHNWANAAYDNRVEDSGLLN
jgi:hypothetical protein